ncbi:serine/threonine protein phosphatase 1 [Kaistia hirudinis]|uniref:Serine/threonine protein phosphatase 1 n=1 Tax=Kaistia hirudinis TaxID=1293440 RepID=A0A840AH50_9HYPH|nr:metallophosphoesterase family protein [Kaistia hirudinis]MBB3929490.1 serine/threonine protein phosphatase 1 [Kaistia hirudinis]
MGATSLLSRLSAALSGVRAAAPAAGTRPTLALPDRDQVLYVIGDIHGCLRQLEALESLIVERASHIADREHVIVLVGDLVDRGPQSASVIDRAMALLGGNVRRIVLAGNHEEAMLDSIESATAAADWLSFGGHETLKSYGADEIPRVDSRAGFRKFQRMMEFLVPPEHIEWLRALPKAVRWRDYFITHAGVRPGLDLDEQSQRDLQWIREPFLSSDEDFGAVVVHGHTPSETPMRYANRISVDTGCFMGGRLSAAMLDRDSVGFLSVS